MIATRDIIILKGEKDNFIATSIDNAEYFVDDNGDNDEDGIKYTPEDTTEHRYSNDIELRLNGAQK